MKTFHSSGTPIGKLVRICRWNAIITIAATVVTQPPCDRNSTSGTTYSTAVPRWARVYARQEGRRSSGKARCHPRLIRRDRRIGLLLIIACTT